MGDHHRPLEALGEDGLVEGSEIVPGNERGSVLLPGARLIVRTRQDCRRLVIGQARERFPDLLEPAGVALECRQLGATAIQGARDERHDEVLGQEEQVVEVRVRHLGLDHPELGEVPARLRLFRPEGGSEAVDPAEGHACRLEIELARLAEVRLPVEVIGLEQGRRALARRWRQDRRIDQDEIALVEEVADRLGDFAPDPQ